MPLRDLLTFGNRKNPFETWPSAPKVRSIAAGKVREKGVNVSGSIENNTNPYPPTLIISFGETGEKLLGLLAEKISQSKVSGQTNLRALLIKETPSSLVQATGWPVRVIEFQRPSAFLAKGTTQSVRFGPVSLFQQVVNYRKYQEWLQESLLDLGGNSQVFFCGSLAEPIVGLLGETLQILRNFPDSLGKTNLFSRVVAFLSMHSSVSNALPADEIFAAYRELGRLSFPGPHQMNTSYGMNRIVRSALLDALFILETPFLEKTVHAKGDVAQLLAESLFTLIHPSARNIWENLRNDLPVSGRIRHESHQAVVHGLGIATLHIPIEPIKRYVAARLSHAAIFGEQANINEGLIHKSAAPVEPPTSTARRFLRSGSDVHPAYDWILGATSPSYFDQVPDLGPDFVSAFQSQISHNLIRALNEIPADTNHLCQSLEWLENHLIQCEKWFRASSPTAIHARERINFQYVLAKWRESVQALVKDLRGWNDILLVTERRRDGTPASPLSAGWRSHHDQADWRNHSDEESVGISKDISSILKSYRTNTEKSLMTGSNDHVYRSVLSDSTGSLKELEAYYTDTVRPELSRFTSEFSSSFTRVRDRLEWWIRLTPDQIPQLYLICWPPEAETAPEPPSQDSFRSDQAQDFADAVFRLAYSQTTALESDLTRNWFSQRIRLFVDFLRQASDAFLTYDHDVANSANNAASRRSYLISHDPTLARDFVSHVFSDTPRFEINQLDGGDATRLTAISLRLNVPFKALTTFHQMRREYIEKSPEKVHLYTQEQIAVTYEKRIWKLERDRVLLSPDFVSLLTDQQLVTLFCQGLFAGVIHLESDESGNQQFWKVSALDNFPEIELSLVGNDGLLEAFRRFVLELPNEADLNQSPYKPFYQSLRPQYLSALTKHVKEKAMSPESRTIRENFKEELERWKRKGDHSDLAQSFSIILLCELDEPVWKDW